MSLAAASSEARQYARIRYRLLLVDFALGFAFLVAFQSLGASNVLAHWWSRRLVSEPIVILGYLLVFGTAYYLVMLPLHFYRSFRLEHRFGLSRLSVTGWFQREAKHVAVSSVLGILLIEGLYALLRRVPNSWPVWATVGWVAVSVVLARIFPTVLLPLFYKTSPLKDQELAKRLLDLCHQVNLPALGVFRFNLGAETRKANAALAGLGKTRRVLLSDTLLAQFTPDEIEGVLAHELGHHRSRHIVKLLVLSGLTSWLAFLLTETFGQGWVVVLRLQGLADIGGFPVLALWLSFLGIMALPLQNGLSRYFERQADRCAVQLTPPMAFANALRRLANLNLADPAPPDWAVWLFYDHPPIAERIAAAQR